jgi:uncharacterized protein (DUF2141 family)
MVLLNSILLALLLPCAQFVTHKNEEQVKLIIEVDNIRHIGGQSMRLAIDKRESFLVTTTPFVYAIVEVRNDKITHTFSLPKGEYAVSVYHDLNGNEKLDKNFFGAPIEPYGFSRNFKPFMRAPKFDEVQISLTQDRKINISLIQP